MTTSAFISQWAEAARRFVNQAGDIALQVNTQISDETFSTEKWAKSTQQLANLVLTTGLEMPAIPCLPHTPDPRDLSDFIEVAPDGQFKRTLSVAAPFIQDGLPTNVIPVHAVFFVPDVIPLNVATFRVGVNWPDLSSGTYSGWVRFTQIRSDTVQSVDKEVTIDL